MQKETSSTSSIAFTDGCETITMDGKILTAGQTFLLVREWLGKHLHPCSMNVFDEQIANITVDPHADSESHQKRQAYQKELSDALYAAILNESIACEMARFTKEAEEKYAFESLPFTRSRLLEAIRMEITRIFGEKDFEKDLSDPFLMDFMSSHCGIESNEYGIFENILAYPARLPHPELLAETGQSMMDFLHDDKDGVRLFLRRMLVKLRMNEG